MNPNFFLEFRQQFSLQARIDDLAEMARATAGCLLAVNGLLAVFAYFEGVNVYLLGCLILVDAAFGHFAYQKWRAAQNLERNEAETRLSHRQYARLAEVREGFPELGEVYRRHLGIGRELTYGDVWAFCHDAHQAYKRQIFTRATQAGTA